MAAQTPRGIRNNNPLNIRKGNDWRGERHPQSDRDFEEFENLEMGLRAGFIIMRRYLNMRPPVNTVRKIIQRWAPASENDTERYVAFVCRKAVLSPDTPIKFAEKNVVCRLVWAMCWMECGCEVSFGRIENAYAMAYRSNS